MEKNQRDFLNKGDNEQNISSGHKNMYHTCVSCFSGYKIIYLTHMSFIKGSKLYKNLTDGSVYCQLS